MKSWFKPDSWAILFGMMNFWLLCSHGLIKVIKQTTNGSWKNKIRRYIILCCLLRLVKSRKSKQLICEFVFFNVMWNVIISNFVWKLKNFGYYSDAWRGQIFLHKCVLHRGMGDPLSSTARWDASSLAGYHPTFCLVLLNVYQFPVTFPSREMHWESNVSSPRTQHNVSIRTWAQTPFPG